MAIKDKELLILELGRQIDENETKGKLLEEGIKELGRQLDYEEALARLQEAGVAEQFLRAINEKPELMESIRRMAPNVSATRADWSCCITIDKPITSSW